MKPNRAAACRFLTPGQAVVIALDAYALAARAVEPPEGQGWFDDNGQPWSGYTAWAQEFIQAICDRVSSIAVEKKIPFEKDSEYPGLSWSDNAPFAMPDNRVDNQISQGVSGGK